MNPKKTVLVRPYFLLAVLLASLQAQADVILTYDDRYAEGGYGISGQYGEGESFWYYDPYGSEFWEYGVGDGVIGPDSYLGIPAGVDGAGWADQFTDTTIANNRFFGNGSAGARITDTNNRLGIYDGTHGISSFDIAFELLSPHAYSLTGSLTSSATGSASTTARLVFGGTSFSGSDSPFSLNGVLGAGNYSLLVEARAFAGANERADAAYDFDLTLTHVPVPAAIWLFGSGLLGLIGFTRRAHA